MTTRKHVESGTKKPAGEMTAAVYVAEDGSVSYYHHKCAAILGFDGVELPINVTLIPPVKRACGRIGCEKPLMAR